MNAFPFIRDRQLVLAVALIALLLVTSCSDKPRDHFQGYAEGEFVYVASPLAGTLESLQVRRGQQVAKSCRLLILCGLFAACF